MKLNNISTSVEIALDILQKLCKYEIGVSFDVIEATKINTDHVKLSYFVNKRYFLDIYIMNDITKATFRFGGKVISKEIDFVEMASLLKVIEIYRLGYHDRH